MKPTKNSIREELKKRSKLYTVTDERGKLRSTIDIDSAIDFIYEIINSPQETNSPSKEYLFYPDINS